MTTGKYETVAKVNINSNTQVLRFACMARIDMLQELTEQAETKIAYLFELVQFGLDLDTHVFNSFTWDRCYPYLKAISPKLNRLNPSKQVTIRKR